MIELVRLPRNYGNNYRYHPTQLRITLTKDLLSTAEMTLRDDEATMIGIHTYVELYTQNGSAGVFRVTSIRRTYGGETKVTLAHALDSLSDGVIELAEHEYDGTVSGLLTLALQHQVDTKWQLGTCEDNNTIKTTIDYNSVYDVIEQIAEEEPDYYFTFDFSTTPWTVNFRQLPTSVLTELRLSKNITGCEITRDDSELCTKLLVRVHNPNFDITNVYDYESVTGQQAYGIVKRFESIEATARAQVDRWVANYFTYHDHPLYNIVIDGLELAKRTGDLIYDRIHLANQCQVILSDFNERITERIVQLEYPDAINDPSRVKVTLAANIKSASQKARERQKDASKIPYIR